MILKETGHTTMEVKVPYDDMVRSDLLDLQHS